MQAGDRQGFRVTDLRRNSSPISRFRAGAWEARPHGRGESPLLEIQWFARSSRPESDFAVPPRLSFDQTTGRHSLAKLARNVSHRRTRWTSHSPTCDASLCWLVSTPVTRSVTCRRPDVRLTLRGWPVCGLQVPALWAVRHYAQPWTGPGGVTDGHKVSEGSA